MSDGVSKKTERLTVRSSPPDERLYQRRAYWAGVFAEGRECPGEWLRTEKWFARATAAQVASDVRNAHLRDLTKMRVRGVLPGDRWEAQWDNDPADADLGHFYVWLRFDGTPSAAPDSDEMASG
jgi:hypothetical protein